MRCDAIQFIIHGSADLLHRRPFFPLFVVSVVVRVVAVAVHLSSARAPFASFLSDVSRRSSISSIISISRTKIKLNFSSFNFYIVVSIAS
jgi:hypothetical protein